MTDTSAGYGSPFVQGARSTSPKEVMFRLRAQHPNASKEEIFRLFKAEANADERANELVDVCIEIAMINGYLAWEKIAERQAAAIPATMQQQQRSEARQERAAEVAARIRTAWLDYSMLNGKALGDCTFKEVGQCERKFHKVAKAGPPNKLVREVLSEAKLRALLR